MRRAVAEQGCGGSGRQLFVNHIESRVGGSKSVLHALGRLLRAVSFSNHLRVISDENIHALQLLHHNSRPSSRPCFPL